MGEGMPMKYFFAVLAAFFFVAALSPAQEPDSGPDPAALWDFISNEKPYNRWEFWPDHAGLQKGGSPHGVFHRVYVNDKAIKAKGWPLGSGAILVKENFNEKKELTFVTVMYKVRGYQPKTGDWYWVKYTPEGSPAEAGTPQSCINCHANAADRDYTMVHAFK